MGRPVTTLVIFFVCLNLMSGFVIGMDIDDAFGVDANIGGNEALTELEGNIDEVPSGTGFGETLFGLYNVLTSFANVIFTYLMPGVSMLETLILPSDIADGLKVLFTLLIAIDIVSFFKGWGL